MIKFTRYITSNVIADLAKKMVFIGGPRQIGKTTFALSLLDQGSEDHPAYLNWDFIENKERILRGELPDPKYKLIIFDEIHKYKDWRNLLKGFYDKYKLKRSFLISGSARLDYYRRGGDSLQGRYHYYRLHPFSINELATNANLHDLDLLLKFGGFPEPLFDNSEVSWKRWQRERISRVIQEDLLNLEKVREISQLQLLASVLPTKVGSIFSVNALREDLKVSFETVESWINILENLYMCFRISPYKGSNNSILRLVHKEKKLYLWDWSVCQNLWVKFENLVASHLLKYCHYIEDTQGDDMDLHFLRDTEKREIDFIVTKNHKVLFAVECKSGDDDVAHNIKYFAKKTDIPIFYQVHLGTKDYENLDYRTRVLPFNKFALEMHL